MGSNTGQAGSETAVTEQVLADARRGDEDAFRELTDPYRRELQAHCYRILGSTHDAEDVLQESLLAAWRGLDGFEGRSSIRSWLYRIATNRCLNALRDGARRPREVTSVVGLPPPSRYLEPTWLEPYPDALLEGIADVAPGPDARYDVKESLALAFVGALQQLPARQRAVLVLRDVLGFRSSEAAEMLEITESAVNSLLKRARAAVDERVGTERRRDVAAASAATTGSLARRFAEAFERDDVDSVIALLSDDARLTMPPEPLEYQGHAAIAAFLRERCARRHGRGLRLVPVGANLQPAFGVYLPDAHAPIARANGLLVLTIEGERISALTKFPDNSLYPQFGLPRTLPT